MSEILQAGLIALGITVLAVLAVTAGAWIVLKMYDKQEDEL